MVNYDEFIELTIKELMSIFTRYYAGIGSRKTPPEILTLMTKIAHDLGDMKYCLRSGGAIGADQAFEKGAPVKEVFKANDVSPETTGWAYDLVKTLIPTDRKNFDSWSPYVKGLLARNMLQILGRDGKSPVDFVVCWAPSTDYTDSSSGGTGYAIRCALKHDIPVVNLFEESHKLGYKLIMSMVENVQRKNDVGIP